MSDTPPPHDTPVNIVLVNLRRSPGLLQSFLESSTADIALIQEPNFGPLIPKRSDTDPDGIPVLGTSQHPKWDCYLPSLADGEVAKVATFVRKSFSLSPDVLVIPLPEHPGTSYSALFLDLCIANSLFCVANVYNHVRRIKSAGRSHTTHSLHPLFPFPLPSFIPTLVAGDFNTHSSTWSLPAATISSWACPLEEWFEDSDLHLVSPPGQATRLGEKTDHSTFQRDSVLDLLLLNDAALCTGHFSSVSISFQDSIGSDHAALFISWFPPLPPRPYEHSILPGFILDDTLRDSWIKSFSSLPIPTINSIDTLQSAASAFDSDIYDTCDPLFKRRHTPDFRGVRWWNAHCEAALALVRSTPQGERASAGRELRKTMQEAKRAWANDELHHTSPDKLWHATAWQHGRRANRIPPLLDIDGSLALHPPDIRRVFSERFFSTVPTPIPPSHEDDPPPVPPRPFQDITPEEVSKALEGTSNKSAPGPSGIGYKLLKWAHSASPNRLPALFNASISLSFHPWKSATVIPIPKPNKPDYRLAKAYRPISLMECCGKLLEKIVASRILQDANRFHLLPPTQFGSHNYHCATDACLSLVHSAQSCTKAGHVTALLLFDIQGFFNNLHVDQLVHLVHTLGFDPLLYRWLRSFLTDRRVSLSFNGTTLDPISLDHGMPQGSPLSPILSAIYTSPLLWKAEKWAFSSLALYVDDGNILATGATFSAATTRCAERFHKVVTWLNQNGLTIDGDKTEYMTFNRKSVV